MRNLLWPLLTFLFLSCTPNQNGQKFVSIGTGGVTGVYYPTGGAISRMLNKKQEEYGIKATVESTAGSVYNINAVTSQELDFGIAQSDKQYQAYHGQSEWQEKGPQKNLRSVFSIHPESITLVATAESGIKSIQDLKGKRVNLGNPGSGQLQNSQDLLESYDLSIESIQAEYVKAVEAPGLLQDERIDAFFYTVGHPNGNIKESTSGRIKVKLVSINGEPVEKMIKKYPYYAKSIIPAKYYPNAVHEKDIETVGVKATLVTAAHVSDDIVYALVKEVFENFEEFRTLHPSYETLTKKSMLEGLSAPLHPGALKYYKESGLAEHINPNLMK